MQHGAVDLSSRLSYFIGQKQDFFERVDSSLVRCGQFTNAVPHDDVRLVPPAHPYVGETNLGRNGQYRAVGALMAAHFSIPDLFQVNSQSGQENLSYLSPER